HFDGASAPVEEPSTASIPDIRPPAHWPKLHGQAVASASQEGRVLVLRRPREAGRCTGGRPLSRPRGLARSGPPANPSPPPLARARPALAWSGTPGRCRFPHRAHRGRPRPPPPPPPD